KATHCSISSLEDDVFSDLINLRTVNLDSNQIEHLPPNLLRNNKLLTKFSCSINKISTLPTGIFDGLSELRQLHLEGNRLENLPEDVFQKLSSLRILDLSKNRLTFLHENIFLPFANLTNLYLSENNFSKIIENYMMVNCSGKGIDRIPEVLVSNATIVHLSNNYINVLSNFDRVTWKNVTNLYLSNNSISNISDYFILPNLKYLWLDRNRLTELPSGLMNVIDVFMEFKIYLSRNNWTCHCHSLFTKNWLLRNRQKIPDFSDIYCRRNSSSVSFTEIVSNDGCLEIPENNFTSSVNSTCTKCVCSDEVNSVCGWKIAVVVLTLLMSLGVAIVSIVYCRRKDNIQKEPKTNEDEVIRVSNELEPSLDEMRWVFFLQFLFLVVNSCQEFWKQWENVSCSSSANSCYESKNFSTIEIFNQSLLIKCGKETIDSRLMLCLNVKNVQEIKFTDCFLSGIDFGMFTFGYPIEYIQIRYARFFGKINFKSASFNNMSSLRSVEIEGVKTSELLNVTFRNVPSLTSLRIDRYNFRLFPNRPFRELINLSELYVTYGKLKVLPEDLFHNLYNLRKLDLSLNNIDSIHPLVFRNLTKLEFLNLGNNRIKDLPNDVLKGLFNLSVFSIYRNYQLSEIPSGFFNKLYNLTKISAEFCFFSSLEEDIFSDLINLKTVYIGFNQIEHLPPNLFRNNKMLTRFSCYRNKISTLPAKIFHGLSKLQFLSLGENRLENLPEDVFQNLSSLQTLTLSRNRLTFLHENIFLPLTNLRLLDL
ncbi:toll-like receptor 13, partial [Centruroides vittatus]|uniref:toll-like receptor 13 n=1 Tax=Centruroides vittatus TaxID=120091 RepID=UPI00350EDF2B